LANAASRGKRTLEWDPLGGTVPKAGYGQVAREAFGVT